MRIEKFKAEHGTKMDETYTSDPSYAEMIEGQDIGYTIMDDHDEPVAAAGLIECSKKRALAWCVFKPGLPKRTMVGVRNEIRKFLDSHQPSPFTRIEMTTVSSFQAGRDWANMLGFLYEGMMREYDDFGNTHLMYSRIRT